MESVTSNSELGSSLISSEKMKSEMDTIDLDRTTSTMRSRSTILSIVSGRKKTTLFTKLFKQKQREKFNNTSHLIEDGVTTNIVQGRILNVELALRSFAFMSLGLSILEVRRPSYA